MRRVGLFLSVIMLLSFFTAFIPTDSQAVTLPPLPAPVKKIVDRTDVPVYGGQTKRSWTWGEYFASQNEPYAESPGGNRAVYYFDKGRLEVTNPGSDQNNDFYATSGLLLKELITGQAQLGDATFQEREPADVVLAGDNPPVIADAPTYASLRELVSFDGSWKSNDMTGKLVQTTLKKGGKVDNFFAGSTVKYASYDAATGHNVVDVFQNFMISTGPVLENGKTVNAPLYNPLYIFGHPISEGYWARVTVAGKDQYVLVQAFERRLLTYTPGNPAAFQVEMGNLGRAYLQWRNNQPGPVPAADPQPPVPTSYPALDLYNQTANNMNSVKSVKIDQFVNGKLFKTIENQAPNAKRETNYIKTSTGKNATVVDIFIENRIFEGVFIEGKQFGSWVFIDVPAPFRFPNYKAITPNDDSVNLQFAPNGSIKGEVTKSLFTEYTDLDGSKAGVIIAVSEKTGVRLQLVTLNDFGNGAVINQTSNYNEYNKPIKIDAPSGAVPYTGFSTSPGDLVVPSLKNNRLSDSADAHQLFQKYSKPSAVPGEIVVKFRDSQTSVQSLNSSLNEFGLQSAKLDGNLGVFKVSPESVQGAIARLSLDARVEYAEPNYLYQLQDVVEPNDPGYQQEYHLKAVKAPRAWSISTGSDVTVAVLDSGIDENHPDLKDNLAGNFDMLDGDNPPGDVEGHGTLVSGTITGAGSNGQFGSGVAWKSKLLMYRVCGLDGCANAPIARGIRAATDAGAKVINISLGGPSDSKTVREAVAYARSKGVVLVVSAGNAGNDVPEYPAAYPGVISVAATGKAGTPSSFTSFGNTVTLTSPGVSICGTIRTGKFGCANGTSFSAPTVTGAVVLLLSVNPNLTPDQVKAYLTTTATPAPGKNPGEFDPKYGYGTLNVFAALRAAATNQFPALPAGIRE